MIDGLRLTFSSDELRALLLARIQHHEQRADWWTKQETRDPQGESEEAPLLPDHMCGNEAERHAWRVDVLGFIRDHLEAGETYRLAPADLELAELLPEKPPWVAQEDYEEQTRIGFTLERMRRSIDRPAASASGWLQSHDSPHTGEDGPPRTVIEETDEFRTSRLDLGDDGPEAILVERK